MAGIALNPSCCCSGTTCNGNVFTIHGCAQSCGGTTGVDGVTINVYTSSGGTLLATGTTNSSGTVTLSWSGTATYWTASKSRWTTYTASGTLTCGATQTATLTPATGYRCLGTICGTTTFADPISETLYATDTLGNSWTLTYNSGTNQWEGSTTGSYAGGTGITCGGCGATTETLSLAFRGGCGGFVANISYQTDVTTKCPTAGGSVTTCQTFQTCLSVSGPTSVSISLRQSANCGGTGCPWTNTTWDLTITE